jgi:hypothetical protein
MVKVLEGTYDTKNNGTAYKKTTFNDYEQREYDYDQLEKGLLGESESPVELDEESEAFKNKLLGH